MTDAPVKYEQDDPKLLKVAAVKCLKRLEFHTRYFFIQQYKRKFVIGPHHYIIFEALERVLLGKCKRLIINIAPRYGKTEIVIKNFISHCLALNAAAKFIHLSYSDDLALDNSEAVKDLVESSYYQRLFPNVKLKKDSKSKNKWYTTEGGGILARSMSGQVTGFGAGTVDEEVDSELDDWLTSIAKEEQLLSDLEIKMQFAGAILIDDPVKPEDAQSDTIRPKINQRFDSTIRNRVNSRNTPIVIICQRTHPEDLVGHLMREEEADEWEIISLPCINEKDFDWKDAKGLIQCAKKGEALWPFKHTLAELQRLERADEVVFGTQYMQDPSPKAGLMFPLKELTLFDATTKIYKQKSFTFIPVDPANLGGDDFAAPVLILVGTTILVWDVLYNKNGELENRERVCNIVMEHEADEVNVEGVLGWVETYKDIETELQERGYENEIRCTRPRKQKHVRIKAKMSFIKNNFAFRRDWQTWSPEYAAFMRCLIAYKKIQLPGMLNKHDDAPDVCEMGATYFKREFPELFAMTPTIAEKENNEEEAEEPDDNEE